MSFLLIALRLFDYEASTLPLFQPALVSANVSVTELHQFLRGHAALRTLRAAAVYDDLRGLGQIRAAYFVAHRVQGHPARAGDVLALEPLVGQDIPELEGWLASKSCRTSSVEMVLTAISVDAVGVLMFAAPFMKSI